MQVTLISLNPPKVREVNPYKKPIWDSSFAGNSGLDMLFQDQMWLWTKIQSSLKEWELSEVDYDSLIVKFFNEPENISSDKFKEWAIGQTLEVEIKNGKAWIV
jgi:hypothetical protein